jgi:hypothetical protein
MVNRILRYGGGCRLRKLMRRLRYSASRQQLKKEDSQRNDQHKMDQPAADVCEKSDQPKNYEYRQNCPKHFVSPPLILLFMILSWSV